MKKVKSDIPDCYNYYWVGIKIKEVVYSRRTMRRLLLMVWGCFNYFKSKLAFISGSIDSLTHQDILNNFYFYLLMNKTYLKIFQQDNARPHFLVSTKNCLACKNIKTIF
ncbi:hypothetical protein NCER_101345 [Vairimorpha ceranae BRL01]|uniref:Uncharacterized protein n=2 Tax=Vairimorpha ceranae TaxID=40302 RepID=C4V9T1_VAIC1|nr:hypothetical protein AAJ76_3000109652 [Vairimorpha ceranae]EEQ82020.1 hypothetical protein NCER_101345 [Vairimorpha ceranae BRL01]KKO76451.1 hypothetical protein AAJ76_3000109652 [Vairimorpha ceranae]